MERGIILKALPSLIDKHELTIKHACAHVNGCILITIIIIIIIIIVMTKTTIKHYYICNKRFWLEETKKVLAITSVLIYLYRKKRVRYMRSSFYTYNQCSRQQLPSRTNLLCCSWSLALPLIGTNTCNVWYTHNWLNICFI